MSIFHLPHAVVSSMRRFPEVMVVCWAYMVLSILQIHGHHMGLNQTAPVYLTVLLNGKETWGQVVEAVSLGIPLALEIQLLIERFWPGKVGVRLVLDIAGIGILILYYCFFASGYAAPFRYTAFLFALAGLCVVTPYFRRNDKFEWFLWQFFSRGIVAVVYWLVLVWGVETAAELVDKLLFTLPSHISSDLLIVSASLFLPVFFCAGISEYPVKLDVSHAPKWWYTVLAYLAVPLLIVYTVVVYVGFAAMLVCWQWPEGIVTPLVFLYALLITVILILAYPYRQEKRWLGRFVCFAPRLLLPLLGLMLIDSGMRIWADGVTLIRYFIVLAGVFMTGCMIYYIAANTVKNTMVVSGGALLVFLSVIGPWNCFAVWRYSQAQLIKNHVRQDGKIVNVGKNASADKPTEFDYYHDHNEERYYYKWDTVDLRGMDYIVTVTGESGHNTLDSAAELVLSYDAASHTLTLTKANQLLYSKDISEFVTKIRQEAQGRTALTRHEMMFTEENEHVAVRYAFEEVSGKLDPSGQIAYINRQDFQLAIKLK